MNETEANVIGAIVLNYAANLIDKGWCRYTFAEDSKGFPVGVYDTDACAFCFIGSILRARSELKIDDSIYWPKYFKKVKPEIEADNFNDHIAKNASEVSSLLREMAEEALKDKG